MEGRDLSDLKRGEVLFFDRVVDVRTVCGRIPLEADRRRATRVVPKGSHDLLVVPKMTAILDRGATDLFLDSRAALAVASWTFAGALGGLRRSLGDEDKRWMRTICRRKRSRSQNVC